MTECVIWTGAISPTGYGRVYFDNKVRYAHRVAYAAAHGEIPEGQLVRHKCDVRNCVNVDHLELGSHKDNSHDMMTRGRWRGNDKITSTDGDDIRWALGLGARPIDVALAYGISRASVYDIRKNRTWTNHDGDGDA